MHHKSQLITHSYQEWTRREKKKIWHFTWQHFNAQLKVSISGHDAAIERFKKKISWYEVTDAPQITINHSQLSGMNKKGAEKNPVPQSIYARKQITPPMPYRPGRSYPGKHTVMKEDGWVTQLPSYSHINWCLCHNDTRKTLQPNNQFIWVNLQLWHTT